MNRQHILAQIAGYPALILMIWLWLGIAERNIADLSLSLFLGVAIVIVFAWLLSTAFSAKLSRAVVFVMLLFTILWAITWLVTYNSLVTDWIAVRVSSARSAAINPRKAAWVYPSVVWTAALVLLASLLPPVLLSTRRMLRSPKYWLASLALILVAFGAPWVLMTWIPKLASITAQTISMVLRFAAAYLIALAALLGFARFVRRIEEVPSEPSPAT